MMQSFQKHLKTINIVDAKFGERTESVMGDSKLKNYIKVCFLHSLDSQTDTKLIWIGIFFKYSGN